MKGILEKSIQAARFRNYNYTKLDSGDEFRYFSKENKSLETSLPIKMPKNIDISRIKYPLKLEKYSEIRYKEEIEEDTFRELLKGKKDDKKRDNKIMDYLLGDRDNPSNSGWV